MISDLNRVPRSFVVFEDLFVVFEAVAEEEEVAVFVVVVAFFFEEFAEDGLDFWEDVVGEVWE